MFGFKKKDSPDDAKQTLLLEDIERTKTALDAAYANFENVLEPDLIDSYIYEVNAIQMKYKFLLKQLKEDPYAKNPLEASGS